VQEYCFAAALADVTFLGILTITLWKDADPDVPILKEAKAEYGVCGIRFTVLPRRIDRSSSGASVPCALKAGDAATMGGLPPSVFVLAAAPATGKDGFAASPFTGSPA
jgi:hypothetical protein